MSQILVKKQNFLEKLLHNWKEYTEKGPEKTKKALQFQNEKNSSISSRSSKSDTESDSTDSSELIQRVKKK